MDTRITKTKIYVGRKQRFCRKRLAELGGVELDVRPQDPFIMVKENGEFYSTNNNIEFNDSSYSKLSVEKLQLYYPRQAWEIEEGKEACHLELEKEEYRVKMIRTDEYLVYRREVGAWHFLGNLYSLEEAQKFVDARIYNMKDNERK